MAAATMSSPNASPQRPKGLLEVMIATTTPCSVSRRWHDGRHYGTAKTTTQAGASNGRRAPESADAELAHLTRVLKAPSLHAAVVLGTAPSTPSSARPAPSATFTGGTDHIAPAHLADTWSASPDQRADSQAAGYEPVLEDRD